MIFTDFETFHPTLNIKTVGSHKYAEQSESMLLSYKVDDRPARIWDITDEDIHAELEDAAHEALHGERSTRYKRRFVAYNTTFERKHYEAIGIHTGLDDWEDVAVLALTCGLPSNLPMVSEALGWGDTGKLRGDRLIQMFCKPAPANHKVARYTKADKPNEWNEFKLYCIRDAELCHRLWNELPHTTYDRERANWIIDQRINDRGFPVDTTFARTAIDELDLAMADANSELAGITGGAVSKATQGARLIEWLAAQGIHTETIDKAAVLRLLRSPAVKGTACERVLELRQQANLNSGSKFSKALLVHGGGRVRGGLRFYGAMRTGRESGQLVQPQNMIRPGMEVDELAIARAHVAKGAVRQLYKNPVKVISSTVRTVIAAPPGRKFVVSDQANIEGRMLAFNAGEQWKIKAFREYDAGTGPDLYKLTYSKAFRVPVDQVTKDQRQEGKVMDLSCGYQGGLDAFHSMAAVYNVRLPDADAQRSIDLWRDSHPAVAGRDGYWAQLQEGGLRAVSSPNKIFHVGTVAFRRIKWGAYEWLILKLPSGRVLFYLSPEIRRGRFGPCVSYMGNGRQGHGWYRMDTYGGKWAADITQASARDTLMPGIARAEAAGYDMVLHSHDELVAEVPDTDEFTVAGLSACLTQREPWYEGLPLSAAGYEDYYYRKD